MVSEQVNLDSKHCFCICINDNNISFSLRGLFRWLNEVKQVRWLAWTQHMVNRILANMICLLLRLLPLSLLSLQPPGVGASIPPHRIMTTMTRRERSWKPSPLPTSLLKMLFHSFRFMSQVEYSISPSHSAEILQNSNLK